MLIPFEGVINQSFDGRGIGLEIQFGLGLRRLMAVHAVTLDKLQATVLCFLGMGGRYEEGKPNEKWTKVAH